MTHQCNRQASGSLAHASYMKLEMKHNKNENENDKEEMVIEEAEAEGWKGGLQS